MLLHMTNSCKWAATAPTVPYLQKNTHKTLMWTYDWSVRVKPVTSMARGLSAHNADLLGGSIRATVFGTDPGNNKRY